MVHRRRRGTAIVETPQGILVVSGRKQIFLLPGGEAKKWESRRRATIRELREETGLIAKGSIYLFSHIGKIHKDYKGGHFQDHHKVFLIKADGEAKPRHEIKYVQYYVPKSNIRLSGVTKEILVKYLQKKSKN